MEDSRGGNNNLSDNSRAGNINLMYECLHILVRFL